MTIGVSAVGATALSAHPWLMAAGHPVEPIASVARAMRWPHHSHAARAR